MNPTRRPARHFISRLMLIVCLVYKIFTIQLTLDVEQKLYYCCAIQNWYYDRKQAGKNNQNFEAYIMYLKTAKVRDKRFLDTVKAAGIMQDKQRYDKTWLGSYTQVELEYLNNYFDRLCVENRLTTHTQKDYARKIAKASLQMDKAQAALNDCNKDADTALTRARENFDVLNKSAKFAEQTRNSTDLGSLGQIIEQVEKGQWVYKHTPIADDDVDKILNAFQTLNESL